MVRKASVANVKGSDSAEMARQALDLAGIAEVVKGKRVFLKANLAGGPSGKQGAIVSEAVTRAVLQHLKPLCQELSFGEGGRQTRGETQDLYERTWIKPLSQELGVRLVNLWDEEFVSAKVPHPCAREEWSIPRILLDTEVVGSLAVMKVSQAAWVTLSMKNFFGVLPLRPLYTLHEKIHEIILDLNQLIKPQFGVIDGVCGWEAGESVFGGRPIVANVVLASRDLVALDATGARVMGFDPAEIKHIRLAEELGLGVALSEGIEVLGMPLAKTRMHFEPVPA